LKRGRLSTWLVRGWGEQASDAARWWRAYQLAENDQADELGELAAAGDDHARRSTAAVNRDGIGPGTWYVDLVHVTARPGSVIVRDLYIDVLVPTDGRHQRPLDLDEFADAVQAGRLETGIAVDGPRRWQRFLDRHLHAAHAPQDGWTDFRPGGCASLRSFLRRWDRSSPPPADRP
jgi:hypothetical protein